MEDPTDTSILEVNRTNDWPIAKTSRMTLAFINREKESLEKKSGLMLLTKRM